LAGGAVRRALLRTWVLSSILCLATVGSGTLHPTAAGASAPRQGLDDVTVTHRMATRSEALRAAHRADTVLPGAMVYHGGPVASTPMPLYLVFWGSDWGTQGKDPNGYDTFSADTWGMVPYLEAMYAGIGHGGERWSAVATQYCAGAPALASSCSAGSGSHVAYPIHGVFTPAQAWYDDAASYGSASKSLTDVRSEAKRAADHFGWPANAQYVVLSPPGMTPDGFRTPSRGFCSEHSWTSLYGFAYTNLPYLPDAGMACGVGSPGAAHALDGISIVAGHEYQETLTDPQVSAGSFTGWYDPSGWENGDKCAWVPAAMGAVTFTTGTFVEQGEWSNADNGCVLGSTGVDGGGSVSLAQPADQSVRVGHPFSLPLSATSSDGGTLSYDAGDLPAGLAIDPTSGIISGTPTQVGSQTVAVEASSTAGGSATLFLSFAVTGGPVTMSSPGTQRAIIDRPFSFTPTATTTSGTLSFSSTGLPSWATLDPRTGQISGTPDRAGTSTVTLSATTGSDTDSWTFSLVVGGAVSLSAIGTQSFIAHKATQLQVHASDSAGGSLTYEASGLPDGLVIDQRSGLISGAATAAGTGTATVTAHGGEDKQTSFSWSVANSTITTGYPGNAVTFHLLANKRASVALGATSSAGLPVTFSSSSWACGLDFTSGTFSGTTISFSADCQILVTATDGYASVGITVDLAIEQYLLTATGSTSLVTGRSMSLHISAGRTASGSVTYRAIQLPAGLSIDASTGTISGTPTATGTQSATVVATDTKFNASSITLLFSVRRPTLTLHLPPSAQATKGKPCSIQLTASDSAGEPVTFTATSLPAGLALNRSTGKITGTPTTAKTSQVTIRATDPGGASATGTLTVVVAIS
jgi:Putative Ig domain